MRSVRSMYHKFSITRFLITLVFFNALLGFWSLMLPAAEQGLVLHYDFNKGRGSIVKDKSGNGNDGKIFYGAKYVKCMDGYALKFNGVNSYVDCGSDSSLNITKAITIEAWIYPEADNSGYVMLKQGNYGGPCLSYYRQDKYTGFYLTIGGKNESFGPKLGLPENKWHHFVATYDSSLPSENIRIYINGELVYEKDCKGEIQSSGSSLYLGWSRGWKAKDTPGFFKGSIDELRIYNRALSEEEIENHYEIRAQNGNV